MAILNTMVRNYFCGCAVTSNLAAKFARVFAFALFALFLPVPSHAQSASAEYKLKAVFLFNFVQFVEWPAEAYSGEHSPTVIGILGADPFGKALEETIRGEIIRGRKIEVRHYNSVKEIKECHILFMSSAEDSKINSTLAALKGRSILTVSDAENFASKRKGMIRLFTEKNKIRLRINLQAVKEGNLSVSSKLLQLADIVPAEKSP
jgi:hypothetical protein